MWDHVRMRILPMGSITVVLPYTPAPFFEALVDSLSRFPEVARLLIVGADGCVTGRDATVSGSIVEERTLRAIFEAVETSHILMVLTRSEFAVEPSGLAKLLAAAEAEGVGAVYGDFYEIGGQVRIPHPVNDYQPGSVRDDFEFGPMMLISVSALRETLKRYGLVPHVKFAGLYDLRLKLSIDYSLRHLAQPLSSVAGPSEPLAGERLFAYVDPRNGEAQKEMEVVFTDYLKRIGAYLSPSRLRSSETGDISFPVEASVIVPTRNRKDTIREAIESALAQLTDFSFNVIVVDNHSTDGTTDVLTGLAARNPDLKHVVPVWTDLAIGGCWNVGLDADPCGRYAVQLDSDDLYSDSHTLQRIVDTFRQGNYAMVVGAYTLVDSRLEEIPPGLVDHREWTDSNGHNNALRVNGLGAPRAFDTALVRRLRFPNVSYGEDYAVALRICREYRVGRIYESLYLCRRWSGNTDAMLSIEEANRHDAFKDGIRTDEIRARQERIMEEGY
jgi:hypothetical protein